ncbi:MAG: VWD domain-containing protein, partial [Geitlerinemataceae cyanobacterium]
VNITDTGGDEGEIFAALVRGEELSAAELAVLKREDDGAIVFLDGEEVEIEQNTQTETLKFFAGEIKEWGTNPERSEYIFFDNKIPDPPIDRKEDFGIVEFDAELQFLLKGSIFADPGNLGNVKFSYPIDVTFDLPNSLSFGEEFSIQPTTSVSNATFETFESQGYQTPDAGIEFVLKPEKAKLSNIDVTTFFGLFDENEDGKVDGIDDINLINNIGEIKLGYTVSQFVQDAGQIDLPKQLGKIQVALLKIDKGDIKPSNASDSDGTLPTIAAIGKTKPQNDFINLELDIDKAASLVFRPLELLGNTFKFPTSEKEKKIAESVKNDLEFKRDELKKIEKDIADIRRQVKDLDREADELFDIGTPEARQEATNRVKIAQGLDQAQQELEVQVPGLKEEIEQLEQNSKEADRQIEEADKKANQRFNFELSYDILDIDVNLGVGLQQDFAFNPDDGVKVTLSVDKGAVDGGQVSTKNSGENFTLQAPSEGSGVMNVTAKYELSGELENTVSFVPKGSLDLKALEFAASAKFSFLKFSTGKIGPLISANLLERAFSAPIPFIGTDPNGTLANQFYRQFDPLKLENIGGTEAVTDEKPETGATKNLVIEKTYKIPYGVPLSISDAASVTEGTEENNAGEGTSRQSQAYFTYNGKYYEWQSRTVSGRETLSQIALETLGDASSNAFNFIAFQNNIADPNVIIAGTTIQVPKEVPLPDTTGYSVFEIASSGGSAKTNYNTADGTATAVSDYLPASGTLSIPDGQGGVILVPIVPDTEQEETETFTVTLTRPDGTPISEGVEKLEATGTILDDDDKPEPPEDEARTYNDPRIITFDKQYHDFQAAGEFTLIDSPSGDLKIQVRQQPVGNNPNSNVTDNTAVATFLGGKRIGLYQDTPQLLIDGVPTEIPNNDSLVVGDGRIYREGNIYTIVYPTGDQLVAKVVPSSRINLSVFLTEERQGQIQGLLGNFNGNAADDLAKRDGTVLSEPVPREQLYGEYADSWRITQAESLFDYQAGEDTNTFTLPNFPRQKVTLADLNPEDVAIAEERIGDSITDPTIREATIIDYILTGFDESVIEEAIVSPIPERVLAIVVPPQAFADFADTSADTPVTLNVLRNDTGTLGVTRLLADFDPTTTNGGNISRNDNGTPDNLSDDVLTYTPPANFLGTDSFNYTLSDGTQIAAGTVTVNVLEPIVVPLTAVEDIAITTTNTPVILDVLSNDSGMPEIPLLLADFDPTTTNGGNISRNDNGTPDNLSDDVLTYTPPANFVGRDRFNYTLSDGTQIAAGTVTIAISATPRPLISELDLATLDGNNGFALNGIAEGDFSGVAVTGIGDFNRDGFDDVAIGGFGADPNGINAAGETYV